MEQQLQQALASVISQGADALSSGITFLQSEIPDIIAQLLLWHLVWAAVKAVFFSAIVIACVRAFKVCYQKITRYGEAHARFMRAKYGTPEWDVAKADRECYEDNSLVGGFGCAICAAGMAAFGFGVFCQVGNAIQIWLAPKIYLVEYAASLAK